MIVRVLGDAQYELDQSALAPLQELDERCLRALDGDDEEGFHTCYAQLLAVLRSAGRPLADDDLRTSDLMLPPVDVSMEEARRDLGEHGLIGD